MSDPNWSEFPNPSECIKISFKKLDLEKLEKFKKLGLEKLGLEKLKLENFELELGLENLELENLKLELKIKNLELKFKSKLEKLEPKFGFKKLKFKFGFEKLKLWLKLESELGHMKGFFSRLKLHAKKHKSTVKKSSLTNFLLDPDSCTGIPRLIVLDHSKWITSKGEHKAWEELQQCEGQLHEHQKIFFEKIEGGDWHKGEIIENEFEGLKLSLKMLEMLKHLVQSTLIEPMRDAVVLMTLIYIVVLSYSLAQVRNDWLIHFLVLCAFFCLHIGSYFSEKAANYFYRVKRDGEVDGKVAA